jgi:deoxycytidylate deaminase
MRKSKFHDEVFQIAIAEAKKSEMFFQLSAVIFRNKKILAIGYNYDFDQKIVHGQFSVHAEQNAINSAKKNKINIKGADMLVIRLSNHKYDNKMFNNAKPCNKCQYHISKNKLNKVYYTIT